MAFKGSACYGADVFVVELGLFTFTLRLTLTFILTFICCTDGLLDFFI